MTAILLEVPEDLAKRLNEARGYLPRVLELGLHEYQARRQSGFVGASAVLEFLASLPTPDDVLALTPAPELATRVAELLEKNRTDGLTPAEAEEWTQYEALEHLVRLAKARAHQKLHSGT